MDNKDISQVCKFSKTQPRPVTKNGTPRPSVRIELTTARILCDALPTEPWSGYIVIPLLVVECKMPVLFLIYPIYIHWRYHHSHIYYWTYEWLCFFCLKRIQVRPEILDSQRKRSVCWLISCYRLGAGDIKSGFNGQFWTQIL